MPNPSNAACRPGRSALAACLLVLAQVAGAADWNLDTAFNGGYAFADWALTAGTQTHLATDASGAVFVATTVRPASGFDREFAVAKFRANGSLDTGFGFFGLRTLDFDLVADGFDQLHGVRALASGRLMLLGTAEVAGNAYVPALARLTAAGNADASFGSDGRRVITTAPWPLADIELPLVAHQPDGKYLFGGWCDDGPSQRSAVVLRVDADGEPDPAFGNGGWASLPVPWPSRFSSITLDRAGRIVLAGFDGDLSNDPHMPLLARFLPDGSPDLGFGIGTGYVRLTNVPLAPPQGGWLGHALAADRDGSLLLSLTIDEDMDAMDGGIVRVTADGTLDTAFGVNGLRRIDPENGARIDALAVRSDGRIVATGFINHTGGSRDVLVARLRADGSLDSGFSGDGLVRFELDPETDGASALGLQAGKPLLAGYANRGGDWDAFALRLQSDLIFSDGIE
jgi:uncharacterized delta-60 repeat protein